MNTSKIQHKHQDNSQHKRNTNINTIEITKQYNYNTITMQWQ